MLCMSFQRSCNLYIVLKCGDALELHVVIQANQMEKKTHKGKEKEKEIKK